MQWTELNEDLQCPYDSASGCRPLHTVLDKNQRSQKSYVEHRRSQQPRLRRRLGSGLALQNLRLSHWVPALSSKYLSVSYKTAQGLGWQRRTQRLYLRGSAVSDQYMRSYP